MLNLPVLRRLRGGLRRPGRGGGLRRPDRGGVTTIVAILLGGGVLLPAGALVLDVGSLYVEREQLQTGADAAAVRVANGCAAGRCLQAADLVAQRQAAKDSADVNAKDGRAGVSDVCGNWGNLPACPPQPTNLSGCIGTPPAGNYVEVRVYTEEADGSTVLPPQLARTMLGMGGYRGTKVAACSRATVEDVCVTAAAETYRHTFDGANGRATITAERPMCKGEEQPFTLVSYTAPNPTFSVPQYAYDWQTQKITSTTRSLTFSIDVPGCYNQVDFIFGDKVINPLTSAVYGDLKVGSPGPPGNRSVGPPAWYNGGTRTCVPKPTVTFTPQCDGSMKVLLGNGSTANVDAAFTVRAGGDSQFLRAAAGTTKTVKVAAVSATTVTVEDNLFRTAVGHWTKPATC